jgi:hypothetical protein
MPHPLAILALLLGLTSTAAAEGATTFFVSPHGNDRWSGTLAQPDAARGDGPLATLQGARDAIRTLKKQGQLPPGGVAVELLAGRYEMLGPLELTAEEVNLERSVPQGRPSCCFARCF